MIFKIQMTALLILSYSMSFAQIITLPDGSIYDGELENNLLAGEGKLTYTNGDLYIGHFKNGLFNGNGIIQYKSGLTYDGQFENGMLHGLGKYYEDDYSYEGNFELGKFTGTGSFSDYNGTLYTGNYIDWQLIGEGSITDKDGNTWTGTFEDGSLNYGQFHGIDGSHYLGNFSYLEFEGLGTFTYANGDQYIGQFSWGSREGKGTFTPKNHASDNPILTGDWIGDEYQIKADTTAISQKHRERESYLYKQQTLLDAQFNALKDNTPNQKDFYSLSVAAYGNQTVFSSEVDIINDILIEHGISKSRQITLVNSMENIELPWATHHAIKQSLNSIENKMNTDEDILLMYATSHGNAELGISLNIHNMSLGSITPEQLSNTINDSQIKWKVIIISACYSGVFIDALKDENSIIITAADSTHTSFGCSNDLDMTFFGKAYFQEAFKNLDFISTFNEAKRLVKIREEEQGYEFSNPQIHVGSNIRNHLGLTTEVIENPPKILNFIKELFGLENSPQAQ